MGVISSHDHFIWHYQIGIMIHHHIISMWGRITGTPQWLHRLGISQCGDVLRAFLNGCIVWGFLNVGISQCVIHPRVLRGVHSMSISLIGSFLLRASEAYEDLFSFSYVLCSLLIFL